MLVVSTRDITPKKKGELDKTPLDTKLSHSTLLKPIIRKCPCHEKTKKTKNKIEWPNCVIF